MITEENDPEESLPVEEEKNDYEKRESGLHLICIKYLSTKEYLTTDTFLLIPAICVLLDKMNIAS